jgi:pyrroline-5-carboxylate reductase
MNKPARFGIIGGNGWLGNAMADAAVASGFIDPAHLTCSARSGSRGKVEIPGIYWTRDNAELAARSDVIVLSVRPDQFQAVDIDARGKVIVSVMAAVPASIIARRTNTDRVIRALPNAAASIRKSFTPWFAAKTADATTKQLVERFLTTFGEASEVAEERHIEYCVGLTGSGAAFPALLAQAMIAHAVSQGLSADFARRAVEGVVVNASQLITGLNPTLIVNEMIEYRGTTAAALTEMTQRGFYGTINGGLEAALRKAEGMAQQAAAIPS